MKLLRESETFKHADEALKKSILKTRLSLWIAVIFVVAQVVIWTRLPFIVKYILPHKNPRFMYFFFPVCKLGPKYEYFEV